MALNLTTLNAGGLRDPSKCACLLGELLNLRVDVAAVQETHFTCAADCRALEDDYVILSPSGNHSSVGVSLLIGRIFNSNVNLVLANDGERMVVADVAIKSFEFQVVAAYAPNIASESVSFFQRLTQFLDDQRRRVFAGDWNVILDPKIDRVERGVRRYGRCESSLVNLMAHHDFVDRFRQGGRCGRGKIVHPLSMQILSGQSVRRDDTVSFFTCPMFHYVPQTDRTLVRVSLLLADRPSLAGCRKFNTSLLEIRGFQDRLQSLFQRLFVGVVISHKRWGSLKHRIRDFAIKYDHQLNLGLWWQNL